MKKLISMLLAAAMLVATLAGCGSTLEEDEKGAEIAVYLGTEILDFDPALAYIDDNMSKLFGLIYEGLTRVDAKGKVVGALMESYEIVEDEDEGED